MKLEERDDEVHHGLDASGRNMILNRATYTCTIITITITIITPLTDETEVLLHARLSTQPSPRRPGMVMFVHSMVFSVQFVCCRPHLRTQSKVPSLLDSLHSQCRVTWPNHISFHLLPMAQRGSMGPTRLSTLHHSFSFVMCSK